MGGRKGGSEGEGEGGRGRRKGRVSEEVESVDGRIMGRGKVRE